MSDPEVVIIGAGPAGVSVAACLARRGISFRLLERGAQPFAALRRVDPDMRLLSPQSVSRLPGMRLPKGTPSYLRFEDYVEALEAYVVEQRLAVETSVDVCRVEKAGNAFRIHATDAAGRGLRLQARHVVSATGIISTPVLPGEFDSARYTSPWQHSLDVRGARLRGISRLLVVGGGASAGEVLDRWLEVRPVSAHCWLSLRSRLHAISNPLFGLDVHYWIWLFEQAPVWPLGWRAGRLREPMQANRIRPALRAGTIARVGPVARYDEDGVLLRSGERLRPDLLVLATGMRYTVAHLGDLVAFDPEGRPLVRSCESTRTPRLYLLGFKFGRTFASPYLRGIARDARDVARRIAQHQA
jgi:putative flavoprotein involved in K+ transport